MEEGIIISTDRLRRWRKEATTANYLFLPNTYKWDINQGIGKEIIPKITRVELFLLKKIFNEKSSTSGVELLFLAKIFNTVAFPKPLRLQLGLSLSDFADLLDTNVGQLSMAESDLRSLPPASLEIISAIEKAVNGSATQATSKTALSKKATAFLNKQIRSGRVRLEALKLQENKATGKLTAARSMLAAAQSFTAPPAGEQSIAVMALLQRKAAKQIELYETKLLQIEIAIAGQQATNLRAQEFIAAK